MKKVKITVMRKVRHDDLIEEGRGCFHCKRLAKTG